jgi:rhomboid protease GluP
MPRDSSNNGDWENGDWDKDAANRREHTHAQPEILPPLTPDAPAHPYEYAYVPPSPAPPERERHWAAAPGTYMLVGVNVLVFVAMMFAGVSPIAPTSAELVRWGANYGNFVLAGGQWWRLLSATFVHVGIIHLATNMWCLWNLGLLGEPLLGPAGLLAVYFLSGVAGNLLSLAIHPDIVGAGASGAVFGLAGILIVLLKSARLPVPRPELLRLRRSVIYFAALNFVIGISTWAFQSAIQIDNMAHLGGFLCGLGLGVPLAPKVTAGRKIYFRRQAWVFGLTALALAAVGFGVANFWS